ncbi:MAG: histidinol phosphate phosphatase domain-containing protein [Deltaproteobacteria bacterium]|jgi:histidinol phosphatase-like PHP family hydrolase|nr:histidinol phosphate phosphatase domain-containing protein [Deltaproteobacteria bacterium]
MDTVKVLDFHSHTFFSDGELCPSELAQRARMKGYRVLGITDHADASNLGPCVEAALGAARGLSDAYGDFAVIPGVELTHVPPKKLPALIAEARRLGAKLVVVHGETPVEPVEKGTNRAAIEGNCDILAHPGLLTEEDATLAREEGVFLELSARGGHSLANGRVAALATRAGAKLLVNSDAHAPGDLLTPGFQETVTLCAGLSAARHREIMEDASRLALKLLGGLP